MGKNRDFSKFPNAITVLDNGNVGIGNTNPYSKLDVRGGGISQTTTDFAAGSAGTVIYMRTGATTGNTTYGLIQVGNTGDNAAGNLVLNQFGGNVGIGTSSPTCVLEVARNNGGSTGGQIALRNSSSSTLNSATEISFLNDTGASASGTRNGRIISQMENVGNGASNMQFWTWNGSADAERVRVTSAGNVGIGVSSPAFKLDVSEAGSVINGTATIGSNMKGIRIYNSVTATNNSAVGLWFSTGPHQAGIASFRATADTTWETSLAFYTHVNTTSNLNDATEKMRISGEGYVTKPSQPSFMAAGNSGSISVSGGNVLVFNANRYNTGGHFNTGNGRFTAPVTGKYLFSWNIYYFGGYTSAIVLAINGSQYSPADVVPYVYRSSTDPEGTAGCTVQLDLSANDYVEVRVRASYGAFQIYMSHSYFTGHLLG